MAWNDSTELVVASNGQVYVAPVGTALPTTPTETLNAAFVGLGFCTEDGVTVTATPDVKDFTAWQSRQAVRRERNQQEIQASFQLEQWNEETVPFAFGGGAITSPSGGVYRFEFPEAGDALEERAMVIDAQDGTRNTRFVFARGNVVDAVEAKFQATELAVLPISFKLLQPTDGSALAAVLFDDAAAFAAGS